LQVKQSDSPEAPQVIAEPGITTSEAAGLYDEAYYRTGCGPLAYERSEHWVNFFGGIADQLIRSLNPARVLDAGCAMGFLVESFWDRGVEAWGIDVSPYAISRVRRDMQNYCRQASLTEPIEGWYDLVTCIEVLEHMKEAEAQVAAANLTRVTDRIVFSSTPDDFTEPTHFTVRPPIYWLKLFAGFGFWPDLEYDASYITQHALLLRRRPEGLPAEALTLFVRSLKFRAALDRTSRELEKSRSHNLEQLNRASLEIQQLKEERSRLDTDYLNSQKHVASLEKEQARLEAERSQLQSEYSSLQHRIIALEKERSHVQAERSQIQTDNSNLRQRIARMEEERTRSSADATHRQQELDRARTEAEAEVRRVAAERDELARELAEIRNSPGWKLLVNYRQWFARQVAGRSWLVRAYEPLARRCLRPLTEPPPALPAPPAAAPVEPAAPATHSEGPVANSEISYVEWIQANEPGPEDLRRQAEGARDLTYRPLLSIVMPVHRVERKFLEECIGSVLCQTYDNWELCVADGYPEAPENRAFLSQIASQDSRVKLVLLDRNLGISGNSNAALAKAEGEFVVLLDHDDVLAPSALYEVVSRFSAERDIDLVYSDHDYIDEASNRFAPLFKPDWSPEILLSANYITHLTVIRRGLFDQLGGFDSRVDSAQDWDLFLRVVRKTQRIAHIPKLLYHWRTHSSSTALNKVDAKVTQAQLESIQRHLDALAWPASAEIASNGCIHVHWRAIRKARISIVIPSKDKVALLSRCIETVLKTSGDWDLEILIVDNGSAEPATTEYYRTLEGDPRIRVLEFDEPFNYSAMNNLGAAHASGDYLLFLNNDTEAIDPEWLRELIGWVQVKEIGAVGAKLLRPNRAIQHAGVIVGLGGFAGHPFADVSENTFGLFGSTEWYRNYLAVTGACVAMRREVFEQVGGFDESFISCGSDVEICLRLRMAGYRVVYNPFARLVHHECATRKGSVPDQDFFTSLRHYGEFLEQGDPYWNPNLSFWNASIALRHRQEQTPLEFARKTLDQLRAAQSSSSEEVRVGGPSEEELFVDWFDFSEDDVRRSKQACAEVRGYRAVRRLVWFIPEFENPHYGGICTILRFADYLRRYKDVSSYYCVRGSAEPAEILRRIRAVDPGCSSSDLSVGVDDSLRIPDSDACIATLWATAFPALKYQGAKRKFYFVQDYEPLFYRAGTGSALAESTYRFGFYGIANTMSLKRSYEMESGQKAVHFLPCVDSEVFFPPTQRMQRLKSLRPYRQLFCYARPKHPRNAFELVAAALRAVKAELGDGVRIVCAGAEWRPEDYGLANIAENLGTLDYRQTGQLYRDSDAGVGLMFTRHPSYIPFELMACGALVIANQNRWTEWLLKDGENCLITEASATCLADTIIRGLENNDERARITATAQALIQDRYSDWASQICRVYDFMCDPDGDYE
jgi:GT2 family glycosyltransferase/glycosyltransferase involved in cell wall biosynthesis